MINFLNPNEVFYAAYVIKKVRIRIYMISRFARLHIIIIPQLDSPCACQKFEEKRDDFSFNCIFLRLKTSRIRSKDKAVKKSKSYYPLSTIHCQLFAANCLLPQITLYLPNKRLRILLQLLPTYTIDQRKRNLIHRLNC